MIATKHPTDVRVITEYGLGAECVGRLRLDKIDGLPVRGLIERVIAQPQRTDPARRTARVLQRALAESRTIDVEVSPGDTDATGPGESVALEDVVVTGGRLLGKRDIPQTIRIAASEVYRGGDPDAGVA